MIANICAAKQYREALGVIDAGDGKGYLSTRLSLEHNIKVLGIDYNPVNTLGALLRSEKFEVSVAHAFVLVIFFVYLGVNVARGANSN